jgi:hypothetical protein
MLTICVLSNHELDLATIIQVIVLYSVIVLCVIVLVHFTYKVFTDGSSGHGGKQFLLHFLL